MIPSTLNEPVTSAACTRAVMKMICRFSIGYVFDLKRDKSISYFQIRYGRAVIVMSSIGNPLKA